MTAATLTCLLISVRILLAAAKALGETGRWRVLRKSPPPLLLITSMSPALADEGASGLYVPGNFGFGAGVTPGPGLYLSSGVGYYDGDIKVYIDGGKIVLDVVKRPVTTMYAALWVPETKILGGQLGLSLRSSYNYAWAHGVVTGLIDEDKTVADGAWATPSRARSSAGPPVAGRTRSM